MLSDKTMFSGNTICFRDLLRNIFFILILINTINMQVYASERTPLLVEIGEIYSGNVRVDMHPEAMRLYSEAVEKGLSKGLTKSAGLLRGDPEKLAEAAPDMVPLLRKSVGFGHKESEDLIIELLPYLAGFIDLHNLDSEYENINFKENLNHHRSNLTEIEKIIRNAIRNEENNNRITHLNAKLTVTEKFRSHALNYRTPWQRRVDLYKWRASLGCGAIVLLTGGILFGIYGPSPGVTHQLFP